MSHVKSSKEIVEQKRKEYERQVKVYANGEHISKDARIKVRACDEILAAIEKEGKL